MKHDLYSLENILNGSIEHTGLTAGEVHQMIGLSVSGVRRYANEDNIYSIFTRLNGTEKWKNGMFKRRSDNVLVTVKYEDGMVHTESAHTTDGVWKTDYKVKGGKVVAWMPFPEPYK